MAGRDIVFIVGSGRSGTSALTRVLSLCGCLLPHRILGGEKRQYKGFWEPIDALKLNMEFLHRQGIAWNPSISFQERDVNATEVENYIEQIQSFLSACPVGPVLVIKDPRITELMEFWLEASRRSGFSAKVVIAVRHPQEVWASRNALSGSSQGGAIWVSLEASNIFWVKANLLAERHSRSLPRVFVEYSKLLTNWRVEIDRVAKALTINMNANEAAIDGFLSHNLHRERYSGPVTETFGYSWTTRIYSILTAAAQDKAIDFPSLDEIYYAYRANARAFRLAIDEVRNKHSHQEVGGFIDSLPIWTAERDF